MTETPHTTCCIVGGGPAGVMTGYLLARAGVRVIVLEKHKDFFRDFRGDTVHPATLDLFSELGLLEDFLKIPHQELSTIGLNIGGRAFTVADFRHLSTRCKFVALMPQWDLLNFLADRARHFPTFDLRMEHEATGLVTTNGRVTGVQVKTPNGPAQISADLVIGCDGRHSITRQTAHMQVMELGVPVDALWFRIGRRSGDPESALGNINCGKALVLINRSDYFQAGLIIRKGSFDQIQQNGLDEFRHEIAQIVPFLADRVSEINDWEEIKLLSIQINRLTKWHQPGLLCIGDAAHAMSPAGGVGINLAIQDAVATANLLAKPLREGTVSDEHLAQVQKRREFPVRVTQRILASAHAGLAKIFLNPGPLQAPWPLKLAIHLPGIQRLLGHAVGVGVRPEHINLQPQ